MVPGSKSEVASRVKQKEGKSIQVCVIEVSTMGSWGSIPSGPPEKLTEHLSIVQSGSEAGSDPTSNSLPHWVALRN